MRNRIISICMIILFIPCLVAVPVYADDQRTFSVLDYATPNGADSLAYNLSGMGSDQVWFDLPQSDSYYYVDIIVRTDAHFLSIICQDGNSSLQFQIIDSRFAPVYRIYGTLAGYGISRIHFLFNYDAGSVIYFLKFDISNYPIESNPINIRGSVLTENGAQYYTSYIDSSPSPAIFHVSDLNGNGYWDITIAPTDSTYWKSFDYIDLYFVCTTGTVDSISAYVDSSIIPISYNFINDTTVREGLTHVTVRLDLRAIDRTTTDNLVIFITGQLFAGNNAFSILSCDGFFVPTQPSPLKYWFTRVGNWFSQLGSTIVTWFQNVISSIGQWGQGIIDSISQWGQSIVDAINPDDSAADDVIDNAGDQADQVGDLTGQMDAVPKPDMNGSGDISEIISPGDLTSYTTFLSMTVNAPYISQVVMLSLILSLAAYVLFGKR